MSQPHGVSRLDYFANNAPPVPEWFKPTGELPPQPMGAVEKFGAERAKAYFRQRGAVPPELQDVADYWRREYPAARMIYDAAVAEITAFEWRRYYAQKMIEVLGEVQP